MAERYPIRLRIEDELTMRDTVDSENNWQLPHDPDWPAEMRTSMEDAIASVVASSLIANPPAYIPYYEMQYAQQALIAFP